MAARSSPPERRIEHVVVLMLENRSFDHMLGFLGHPSKDFPRLEKQKFYNKDRNGNVIFATKGEASLSGPDPDHSHAGTIEQLGPFAGVESNGGFVSNYEGFGPVGGPEAVMQCLDPETQVPVLATLAKSFAVCTAWHSSVPGETWPNRNFAHAATSDDSVDIEFGFYYDPTIFELIAKKGASWRVYYDGPPELWCFRRLWRGRTLLDFLLGRQPKIGNWFPMSDFESHVSSEDMASYTFIEPAHNRINDPNRQTNSQHPHNNRLRNGIADSGDFHAAEQLIKKVYQALLAQRELFSKTLLVVLYDEHGGFYDRAKPPIGIPPGDPVYRTVIRRLGRAVRSFINRLHGRRQPAKFHFDRLGVRIPAVLVSPWIKAGTIVDKVLDHSSIPKTVRELFAREASALTDRDEWAASFQDVVLQSPLDAPRPGPDPDDPDSLPDLDSIVVEAPHRGVASSSAKDAELGARKAEGKRPERDLDRSLELLTERVHKRLRLSPQALASRIRVPTAARRRRATRGAEAATRMPLRDPLALFENAAERARRSSPRSWE